MVDLSSDVISNYTKHKWPQCSSYKDKGFLGGSKQKQKSHACFSLVCPFSSPSFRFLIWKGMVFPWPWYTAPYLWGDISDCPRIGGWDQECQWSCTTESCLQCPQILSTSVERNTELMASSGSSLSTTVCCSQFLLCAQGSGPGTYFQQTIEEQLSSRILQIWKQAQKGSGSSILTPAESSRGGSLSPCSLGTAPGPSLCLILSLTERHWVRAPDD